MTDDEQFQKVQQLRNELATLRSEFRKIHDQKEAHYHAKQALRQEILQAIAAIKDSRKNRDDLTSSVRAAKEKRHTLSDTIKQKIDEAKKLKEERDALVKKKVIVGNPSQIRAEIAVLERKVETEVMSFDKEKAIMKAIKEKKKQLLEYKDVEGIFEKIRQVSQEIDALKKEADVEHGQVQEKADQSQQKHEHFITTSKHVDELRVKEKNEQQQYDETKKQYLALKEQLSEKVRLLDELSGEIHSVKKERAKKSKETVAQMLHEKEQIVEEKIKKRQKLTTEDILLFQKMNEKSE